MADEYCPFPEEYHPHQQYPAQTGSDWGQQRPLQLSSHASVPEGEDEDEDYAGCQSPTTIITRAGVPREDGNGNASDEDADDYFPQDDDDAQGVSTEAITDAIHIVWGGLERCNATGLSTDTDPGLSTDSKGGGYIKKAMQNVKMVEETSISQDDGHDPNDEYVDVEKIRREVVDTQEEYLNRKPLYDIDNPTEQENQVRLHHAGKCTPCHYMGTKGECKKGEKCSFCHEQHAVAPEAKPRPRKATREHYKRVVDELDQVCVDDPAKFKALCTDLIQQGGYMSIVVKSKLKVLMAHYALDPELLKLMEG